MQDEVLERFYRAYFTEQRSLFDSDSLVTMVVDAGLDGGEARDVLQQDRYVPAVVADLNEARAIGITGVPFFLIDEHYGVSGAQSTDVFSQVLTRVWDERVSP